MSGTGITRAELEMWAAEDYPVLGPLTARALVSSALAEHIAREEAEAALEAERKVSVWLAQECSSLDENGRTPDDYGYEAASYYLEAAARAVKGADDD